MYFWLRFLCLLSTVSLALLQPRAAAAQTIDPTSYYTLSTQYLGENRVLDVINGGPKNHMTHLAPSSKATGQRWRLTPAGGGNYKLTNRFTRTAMCLDVVNGGAMNNQPQLRRCANTSGQLWSVVNDGRWVRLKTKFRGPQVCLDVFSGGPSKGQPELRPCGNFQGQKWRLTAVRDAPREEVAGNFTFKAPIHGEKRLDWCMTPGGQQCGRAVADRLCKRRRFRGVAAFQREDVASGTSYIGGGSDCRGRCAAFGTITCQGKLNSDAVFGNPISALLLTLPNGKKNTEHRLDACLEPGRNCGAAVADAFCKRKGFKRSIYFEVDEPVIKKTIMLSGRHTCEGRHCRAMTIITCDR